MSASRVAPGVVALFVALRANAEELPPPPPRPSPAPAAPPVSAPAPASAPAAPSDAPPAKPERDSEIPIALPNLTRPPQKPIPTEQRRWYGWKNMLADGSWMGVSLLGASLDARPIVIAALGGYLLGSPAVHGLVQDHWGKAALSAGMRFGATGLFFAAAFSCGSDDLTDCPGALLALIPLPAVMIIDDVFIARETVRTRTGRPSLGLRVTPWVAPSGGGALATIAVP